MPSNKCNRGEQTFRRIYAALVDPQNKEDVASYVLSAFGESLEQINQMIMNAMGNIIKEV